MTLLHPHLPLLPSTPGVSGHSFVPQIFTDCLLYRALGGTWVTREDSVFPFSNQLPRVGWGLYPGGVRGGIRLS